ncbi:MAG: hypothetical protein G01um101429_284 [Parcubacteria group bacterium Gr01-1014_29]|nr:MAG: hypothetical protein G01um101429_284 [Parcubacteria group bacterium Gr01-1014_29]
MYNTKQILFIILLLASLLRIWSLGSGDTLSDEVLYSFRAVGMLDFDEAADQTTPLEWFDPYIPSWTKFSFHDHPPLVFLIQHVFMRIFGETPFTFRLPSALFGIASVYLLYLIGKHLYSEKVGLFAAAFLGVTVNHVVISRLGLQESYVIFFILLAIFFFIRAGEQQKFYIGVGAALGLAALTKYTTLILLPIFFTYLMFFRRKDFAIPHVWIGTALALMLFSPVLYYNYRLFRAVGHFDFQLSYIVGQNPEVWSIQPGKEEFPTLAARASAFLPNLIKFNSWMFLVLFAGSLITFVFSLTKKIPLYPPFLKGETPPFEKGGLGGIFSVHAFLLISFFWLLLLIIGTIGPSLRFLAMLTPFLALGISITLVKFSEVPLPYITNMRKWDFRNIAIGIIISFEILYTFNSQLIPYPKGPELWTWSGVRMENYNWGYQELDEWMRKQTDDRMPALAFEQKYHFIEEIHKQALAADERAGKEPLATLFVYDKNVQSTAQLWILDRLQIYHAWPIITADTYVKFLNEKGADYFERSGFKEIYFIFPTENVPWKKTHLTDIGAKLEQALTKNGLEPYTIIENKRSEPIFRIYRKELK